MKLFCRNKYVAVLGPKRLVFQKEKGAEAQPQQPNPAEKKPEDAAKKAETYTAEDLQRTRLDTIGKIEKKIKHPGVQQEVKTELQTKLDPLEKQLGQLEAEKNAERMKVKTQVDAAVTEVLDAKREFKDLTVSFAGKEFTFTVLPPQAVEQYEAMEKKALATLGVFSNYAPRDGTIEGKPSLINGEIIFTVTLDRKLNPKLREGAYKDVTISGAQVTERYSDTVADEISTKADQFRIGFDTWKKGADANFQYGDPPQTFPPAGFDLNKFLQDRNMTRAELKPEFIMQIGDPSLKEITDLNVAQKIQIIEYEKKGNGYVPNLIRIEESQTLSQEKNITEIGKDILRVTKVEYRIVNQQRRRVEVVTDFWPRKPGEKSDLKVKKIEEYEDGVVTSRSQFDREGKITERVSRVRGCDGVEAVDKPVGPPYVEVPVLDDHGKPVMDDHGKPLMERKTDRAFLFKDQQGKVTDKIVSLPAENEARKKAGLPPMSEDDYMKMLGSKLKTKEQMHAYLMLMFKYRYDASDQDSWQKPENTINRVENGQMLGDCEDYAFVLKKILESQGKKAYVVGLPGHAECVTVSRGPDGKYHATSYGTFGVDTNGNRVGEKSDAERSKGYDTPEAALRSLQNKWAYKESGNIEMKDGNLFDDYGDKLSVMSIEPSSKNTRFASLLALQGMEFDADGKGTDSKGRFYQRLADGSVRDPYGNVFKGGLMGYSDDDGETYSLRNGALTDKKGNQYVIHADGSVGKYSPLKVDDGALTPHEIETPKGENAAGPVKKPEGEKPAAGKEKPEAMRTKMIAAISTVLEQSRKDIREGKPVTAEQMQTDILAKLQGIGSSEKTVSQTIDSVMVTVQPDGSMNVSGLENWIGDVPKKQKVGEVFRSVKSQMDAMKKGDSAAASMKNGADVQNYARGLVESGIKAKGIQLNHDMYVYSVSKFCNAVVKPGGAVTANVDAAWAEETYQRLQS